MPTSQLIGAFVGSSYQQKKLTCLTDCSSVPIQRGAGGRFFWDLGQAIYVPARRRWERERGGGGGTIRVIPPSSSGRSYGYVREIKRRLGRRGRKRRGLKRWEVRGKGQWSRVSTSMDVGWSCKIPVSITVGACR